MRATESSQKAYRVNFDHVTITKHRVPNEKVTNETNWTPNQYTEYPDLYIKTAKQAAPNS